MVTEKQTRKHPRRLRIDFFPRLITTPCLYDVWHAVVRRGNWEIRNDISSCLLTTVEKYFRLQRDEFYHFSDTWIYKISFTWKNDIGKSCIWPITLWPRHTFISMNKTWQKMSPHFMIGRHAGIDICRKLNIAYLPWFTHKLPKEEKRVHMGVQHNYDVFFLNQKVERTV